MIEINTEGGRMFIPYPDFIELDVSVDNCLIDGVLLSTTSITQIIDQLPKNYISVTAIDGRVLILNLDILHSIQEKDKQAYLQLTVHDDLIPLKNTFDELKSILGCGIQETTIKTKGL